MDALSDDGRFGLTTIWFIGSVFSPWYAAARRRGGGTARAANHVSVNAVLYGPGGRWAMTERKAPALVTSADGLGIGPSRLSVSQGRVLLDIDEWTVPVPRRVRGRIELTTGPVFDRTHALDAAGRHGWRPVAPYARVRVAFDKPGLSWEGDAYLDTNSGSEPIERAFRSWTWSRARGRDATTIFYDLDRRDGTQEALAIRLGEDGRSGDAVRPEQRALPGTLWRVGRSLRSETEPSAIRTFEDTPFYTRTAAMTSVAGERCATISESVDLDRFASRWVQTLLPFRMPRVGRG